MTQVLTLPTAVPGEMIQRIAQGLEEPEFIASEYGYDAETYAQLEQQDWFRSAVFTRRDTLKKEAPVVKKKQESGN